MATRLSESRVDHRGEPLPEGVYALVNSGGEVVSYKDRWRELDENGVQRQRSKSFSPRELRSLDRARAAAINHREGALEIVRAGDAVLRTDRAVRLTLGELFKEWIANHAAHNTGERYARDSVRTWDKHIEPRLGKVRLGALAADPIAVERIIEAVLNRPRRDPLAPIRDAALVAAMGFTVAARPSEWLASVTWTDVGEHSVQLQAVQNALGEEADVEVGLKTGARAALLLPNAYDRLLAYREALVARHGTQRENALVFQVLSEEGPVWYQDGFPVEWSDDQ